jgi:hypothetical protein
MVCYEPGIQSRWALQWPWEHHEMGACIGKARAGSLPRALVLAGALVAAGCRPVATTTTPVQDVPAARLSPVSSTLPTVAAAPAFYFDAATGLDLAALVHDAATPVYGPPGAPFGLHPRSGQYAADVASSPPNAVSLDLASDEPDGAHVALLINTERVPNRRIGPPRSAITSRELVDLGYNPYDSEYFDVQSGSGVPRPYPTGDSRMTARVLTVDGMAFDASVECWEAAGFCVFVLSRAGLVIAGAALGVDEPALTGLLSGLVNLKNDVGLVMQYQREMSAAWRVSHLNPPARPALDRDSSLRTRTPVHAHERSLLPHADDTAILPFGPLAHIPRPASAAPAQSTTGDIAITNLSDHDALVVNNTWYFNSRFTLLAPAGFVPRVVDAQYLDCASRAGQPHVLDCSATSTYAQLTFTVEPVP